MAVVKFLSHTKYCGMFYEPHTEVEVKESDVDSLVKLGAIIISRDTTATEEAIASVAECEEVIAEEDTPENQKEEDTSKDQETEEPKKRGRKPAKK